MEILSKATSAEPEVETDPMEKVNQKLAEAGRHLARGLTEAVKAISLWGRTVFTPTLKRVGQEGQKRSESPERNRVEGGRRTGPDEEGS